MPIRVYSKNMTNQWSAAGGGLRLLNQNQINSYKTKQNSLSPMVLQYVQLWLALSLDIQNGSEKLLGGNKDTLERGTY